jgi:hypothetical protein
VRDRLVASVGSPRSRSDDPCLTVGAVRSSSPLWYYFSMIDDDENAVDSVEASLEPFPRLCLSIGVLLVVAFAASAIAGWGLNACPSG